MIYNQYVSYLNTVFLSQCKISHVSKSTLETHVKAKNLQLIVQLNFLKSIKTRKLLGTTKQFI